jgi:hypothetical protein
MRPLFTIHAGEYVVGEELERKFKSKINVWVPTKDIGIDLLVTNKANTSAISFQVRFSRDYLTTHLSAEFQEPMRACGWFKLSRNKIKASTADYWVFVVLGSKKRSRDYVIPRPKELLKRLDRIHGRKKDFQVYIWVTEKKRCWETRNLLKSKQRDIAFNTFVDRYRDFSPYLNNWRMIKDL